MSTTFYNGATWRNAPVPDGIQIITVTESNYNAHKAEYDAMSAIIRVVDGSGESMAAVDITYDGTGSTLSATDVQAAIDEVAASSPVGLNALISSYENRGYLGENFIPFPYYNASKTENGITYTVNADGSITATGTATADSYFNLALRTETRIQLAVGQYTVSGCPTGGSTSTYYIISGYGSSTSYVGKLGTDIGSGATFTVDETISQYNIAVQICIVSGQTVSDLVFKPMLTLGTDVPSAFKKYVQSNDELAETMQPASDDSLETTSKTVVGAINETNSTLTALKTLNSVTLTAGETSVTITDSNITSDSLIDFYYNVEDGVATENISYETITVTTGSVTLTFDALETDLVIKYRIW